MTKELSEKQKAKRDWDNLKPEEQEQIKKYVVEWRKQLLESFKKMATAIETTKGNTDKDNYEIKSALIWKFRQDDESIKRQIPLSAICNAFNISVTYYNNLKNIHYIEWDEWFKEGDKHKSVWNPDRQTAIG